MLQETITKALKQINTVEVFLQWMDILYHSHEPDTEKKRALDILDFPRGELQEEHLFRHNSVISRLYNIFENFVEASLTIWITRIPRYYKFEQLAEGLQNKYRDKLSIIIRNIDRRQFRHLDIESVLEKYLNSIRGNDNWSFVNEALVYHEQNLRRSEIEGLFNSTGFKNFWTRLENNKNIKALEDFLGERVALDKKLEDFVGYRNDSAHSIPDEILGSNKLREWIEFIKLICRAIEEVVSHEILKHELRINPSIKIGNVIERYHDNKYVCLFNNRCWLRKGQTLVFLTDSKYVKTKVESLQLNSISMDGGVWVPYDGVEVGIKIGDKVSKKSIVVSLQ